MPVRRIDLGEITKPTRLDNGYLRSDARITRTGVFVYKQHDGTEVREYRPPEEVFKADTLASFNLVALTNDHPGESLTAKNTSKYQVGTVADARADGKFVAATVLMTDAVVIDAVEAGKRELSCGYTCDLEMTAGVSPDGERYSAIQRNIRGNHVAIVAKGRAGSEVSLRLDADGNGVITRNEPEKNKTMKTIRIDGIDYDLSEQATLNVIQQKLAKLDADKADSTAALVNAKADTQKEKARADKAEEELSATKKKLDAATSPEALAKITNERVTLVRVAERIINDEKVKLDTMDDASIKKAVVLKVSPEAKLDGADPVYVNARFDAAVESFEKEAKANPALNAMRNAGQGRDDANGADPVEAARKRNLDAQRNAWKGEQPKA